MLYKLAPKPGYNVIPEEIEDFYIKDKPDVAAIAVVALQEAISNWMKLLMQYQMLLKMNILMQVKKLRMIMKKNTKMILNMIQMTWMLVKMKKIIFKILVIQMNLLLMKKMILKILMTT